MNKRILQKSYSYTDFISSHHKLDPKKSEQEVVDQLFRLFLMFQERGKKDVLKRVMRRSQSLEHINPKNYLFSEWIGLTETQIEEFKEFISKRV